MKRLLIALGVGAASLVMASPAAAHTQTVTPPSKDEPVVQGPIARPWVQGHCQAQAPAVSGEASGGVAVFAPQGFVPCADTVMNPGGQVTGP